MLKLGTQNLSGIYVGEQKIKKAFVGTELVFEDNPTYTVYFYAIEGTDTSKILNSSSWTVTPGESVTVYPWTIDGYIFEGWYEGDTLLSSATGAFVYTPEKPVTTIYLRYAVTYNLTINVGSDIVGVSVLLNGADVPNPQLSRTYTFKPGTQITLEGKDFPSGWQFSHWYNDFTSFSYTNPWTFTMPSKNVGISLEGKKASRLPAGYTELQYVEFPSSSCYIKTPLIMGYIGSGTIEAKFEIVTHNTSTTAKYLFYSYASSAYFYLSEVKSGVKGKCGTSSTAETTFISNNTTSVINVSVASSKFTVNGVTASMGTKPSSNTGQIYFNGNGSNGIAKLRLYSWKSASASSTTSSTSGSDYVPCKNASGTVGLFNLRNNTFLSATSSTQLTAGPAV